MKKFFIITNEHKDKDLSVTSAISAYIEKKGGSVERYISSKSTWEYRNLRRFKFSQVDADYVIVLGGDGTLVRAARDMAPLNIPLIGVNLGTLGYLCELDENSVYDAIDLIFENKYEIESRMMIKGIGKNNQDIITTRALNDIVIHRSGMPQIVSLTLTVNGEYLAKYNADGVIISTPTGSTGYSMSAGGPIVDPKAKLILITPINPHGVTTKSIVVGDDAVIEIQLTPRREELDEMADVSCDGDTFTQLRVGESIIVHKAEEIAQIMKLNNVSFLQILSKKMQGER